MICEIRSSYWFRLWFINRDLFEGHIHRSHLLLLWRTYCDWIQFTFSLGWSFGGREFHFIKFKFALLLQCTPQEVEPFISLLFNKSPSLPYCLCLHGLLIEGIKIKFIISLAHNLSPSKQATNQQNSLLFTRVDV